MKVKGIGFKHTLKAWMVTEDPRQYQAELVVDYYGEKRRFHGIGDTLAEARKEAVDRARDDGIVHDGKRKRRNAKHRRNGPFTSKPYAWEWDDRSDDSSSYEEDGLTVAIAKIDAGPNRLYPKPLNIFIEKHVTYVKGSHIIGIEVEFTVDGSMRLRGDAGTAEAGRIFATVIDVVKSFLNRKRGDDVEAIMFSACWLDGDGPSRGKLYKMIGLIGAKVLARSVGKPVHAAYRDTDSSSEVIVTTMDVSKLDGAWTAMKKKGRR